MKNKKDRCLSEDKKEMDEKRGAHITNTGLQKGKINRGAGVKAGIARKKRLVDT